MTRPASRRLLQGASIALLVVAMAMIALVLQPSEAEIARADQAAQRMVFDAKTGELRTLSAASSVEPPPLTVEEPITGSEESDAEPEPLPTQIEAETAEPQQPADSNPAMTAGTETSLPFAALSESSPLGSLPRIAEDGRKPWQAYAPIQKALVKDQPAIAILLTDLGLQRSQVETAMQLPAAVSFAFSTYADDLATSIGLAHTAQHESWVILPVTGRRYPADDAGPLAISPDGELADLPVKLRTILAAAPGAVGLVLPPDETISLQSDHFLPILDELRSRGLLLVASGEGSTLREPGLGMHTERPYSPLLDATQWQEAFADLELKAKNRGKVLAAIPATPVAIRELKPWLAGLEGKNIALVPVTSMAEDPPQ